MTRAKHSEEMRVALAERCSLSEARAKLAALRYAAALASRHKLGGGAGSSFEGRDSASQADVTAHGFVNFNDAGEPRFWWKEES